MAAQQVQQFWWHTFGPRPDGSFYVFGPSVTTTDQARSLASIVSLPYAMSWNHEPTPGELAAADVP